MENTRSDKRRLDNEIMAAVVTLLLRFFVCLFIFKFSSRSDSFSRWKNTE